jgi:hypothetical protein
MALERGQQRRDHRCSALATHAIGGFHSAISALRTLAYLRGRLLVARFVDWLPCELSEEMRRNGELSWAEIRDHFGANRDLSAPWSRWISGKGGKAMELYQLRFFVAVSRFPISHVQRSIVRLRSRP